ncbi:MAG TPA: hypothetical protein VFS97_14775 [Nitrososphaeraceae archaeon]|nr:hypothetical protein [Nitrososphaeraceae archaeon]
MNNKFLAIALLIAGALLTTTAITTMVPDAYADNKQKAEDDSAAAIADCDHNDVERAGFDCFGIAANDIDVDLGRTLTGLTALGSSNAEEATLAGQP